MVLVTERPVCETCDRLRAIEEDYERFAEGDGEHLCWEGIDCEVAAVDWRLRAFNAESEVELVRRCLVRAYEQGFCDGVEAVLEAGASVFMPDDWEQRALRIASDEEEGRS